MIEATFSQFTSLIPSFRIKCSSLIPPSRTPRTGSNRHHRRHAGVLGGQLGVTGVCNSPRRLSWCRYPLHPSFLLHKILDAPCLYFSTTLFMHYNANCPPFFISFLCLPCKRIITPAPRRDNQLLMIPHPVAYHPRWASRGTHGPGRNNVPCTSMCVDQFGSSLSANPETRRQECRCKHPTDSDWYF